MGCHVGATDFDVFLKWNVACCGAQGHTLTIYTIAMLAMLWVIVPCQSSLRRRNKDCTVMNMPRYLIRSTIS